MLKTPVAARRPDSASIAAASRCPGGEAGNVSRSRSSIQQKACSLSVVPTGW
jgi:hypothetical protein